MTDIARLNEQREDYATAFKQANEQLKVAQGTVQNKTLETALWGWRWGRVVNEIHGNPTGKGRGPGILTHEQTLAYCQELGLSMTIMTNGQVSGHITISTLRRVANRVTTEKHLRELVAQYGSLWRVADSLRDSNAGVSAQELRDRSNERSRRRKASQPLGPGYGRFVPPQSWVSYLVQQGLSRGEVSAALCLVLEAVGAEESLRIWERARRPDRYSERGDAN